MELHVERHKANPEIGPVERGISAVVGTAALGIGARLIPRVLGGWACVTVGAYLVYRGLSGRKNPVRSARVRVTPEPETKDAGESPTDGRATESPPEATADLVTQASRDSFPASDPPSWNHGTTN